MAFTGIRGTHVSGKGCHFFVSSLGNIVQNLQSIDREAWLDKLDAFSERFENIL